MQKMCVICTRILKVNCWLVKVFFKELKAVVFHEKEAQIHVQLVKSAWRHCYGI